jgi:SAM-dependent methyltransferase
MRGLPAFYQSDGLNVATYDARAEVDKLLFDDPIPFYLEELATSGGPLLELGCGTGRLARAAAAKGVQTVGLDLSAAMLARAKQALPDGNWVQGDMSAFAIGRQFQTIAIPMRGLMELSSAEAQRACLACCHTHLAEGGRLVFDLLDPDLKTCLPEPDEEEVDLPPVLHPERQTVVVTTAMRRVNDPLHQLIEETWRFREIGQDGAILTEEIEQHRLRWIYQSEMRLMLEVAGFEVLNAYSSFRRTAPAYGADQVWVCGLSK